MGHVPRDGLLGWPAAEPVGLFLWPDAFHLESFVSKHEHFVHAHRLRFFKQIERKQI